MEPTPTSPSNGKRPLLWPIIVNLAVLVGINIDLGGGTETTVSIIIALVFVNLLAALLVSRFNRLNWVIAFLLSALLLPLIEFGVCAAFIAANGGIHGGP